MLVASIALLATLVPALAGHVQPAHIRHRHLAIRQQEQQPGAVAARANDAHAAAHKAVKRTVNKRGQQCRPRGQSKPSLTASSSQLGGTPSRPASDAAPTSTSASSAAWTEPSASSASSPAWSAAPQAPAAPSPSAPAPSPSPAENSNQGDAGSEAHWGVLAVTDITCGWSDANSDQPNGAQAWLNCGIDGAGWTPPQVSIDQLIAAELDASDVFSPCADYIDKFKQYGAEFNIYPIMLASFAMQESTCNPGATGGGGEAGLMQIAPPNCEAGFNCYDTDYNIRRGAQLFRQMIDANGGNVLAAIGAYNGWRIKMTVGDATAARWTNCRTQNNLDYLYQYCNGWMQNKNAHSMGTYFNLADC